MVFCWQTRVRYYPNGNRRNGIIIKQIVIEGTSRLMFSFTTVYWFRNQAKHALWFQDTFRSQWANKLPRFLAKCFKHTSLYIKYKNVALRIRIEGFKKSLGDIWAFTNRKIDPKNLYALPPKLVVQWKCHFTIVDRFNLHSIKINLARLAISRLVNKDNSDRVVSIFGI